MMSFKKHGIGYLFIVLLLIIFMLSVPAFITQHVDIGNRLNGEVSRQYEDNFDSALPHINFSSYLWREIKYLFFQEALADVLIGNDGWLFTAEEFSFDDNYLNNIENNQKYILSIIEKLSRSGTQVIIASIPAKSRIYEEHLGKYKIPEYRQDIYLNFLDFLKSNNIRSVNLLKIFTKYKNNKIFFKTDTHWTPLGARLAAKNIAKESNIIGEGGFIPTKNKEVAFQGDLVKFTSRSNFNDELFTQWKTRNIVNENIDLFADKYFPVILVGTSYSADEQWNFEGFLKEFLQQDVLNLSDEGLGPFQIMDNYINTEFKTMKHPKILIWGIPERYLPMSFSGDKS